MSDPRPLTELVTPHQARKALRGALRIARRWGLTDEQTRTLLGSPAPATFQAWQAGAGPALDEETIWRIGHIIGIYFALKTLLPDDSVADSWVTRPNTNPLYKGRRALDVMLESLEGLEITRRHLQAQLNGW